LSKQEIKKIRSKKDFLIDYKVITIPSIKSILIIVFINALLLFISLGLYFLFHNLWNEQKLDILIESNLQLYSILVSIIIAFVILIAEGLRDGVNDSKGRTILSESMALPSITSIVIFFVIVSFVKFFGLEDFLAIYESVFNVLILCVSTFGLFQVLRLFIQRDYFSEKQREIESKLLRSSLEQQLSYRIQKNISYKEINIENYSISYTKWTLDDERYETFYSEESSVYVSDIRPSVFKELIQQIETILNTKGLTLTKKTNDSKQEFQVENEVVEKPQKPLSEIKMCIHAIVNDSVDDLSRIFSFDKKSIFSDDEKELIKSFIPRIFLFSKKTTQIERFSDYNDYASKYILAINEENYADVKSMNEKYRSMIETFWNFLRDYQIQYSPKDATNEMSYFSNDITWIEISTILEDLEKIFKKAVVSSNNDLLLEAKHLPLGLLYSSVNKKDYYIFKSISRWYFYVCYEESIRCKDINPQKAEYLRKNAISMVIHEIATYILLPHFRDDFKSKKDSDQYIGFIEEILRQYMYLIKSSVKNSDFDSFKYFLNKFVSLGENRDELLDSEYKIQSLETDIKISPNNKLDTKSLEKQLIKEKKKQKYEYSFKLNKYSIIWGICSWLINKDSNKYAEQIKQLLTYIPNEVKVVSDIYLNVVKHESNDRWGWEWWRHEDDRDFEPKVHSLGFEFEYILILTIKLIETIRKDPNGIYSIDPDRHYAFAMDSQGSIKSQLENIKSNSILKEYLNDSNLDDHFNKAIEILEKAKEQQEKDEELYIKNYNVPNTKLNSIGQAFISEYKKNNQFRSFLTKNGFYSDQSNIKDEKEKATKRMGINQIINKESFVDEWHVHYPNLGSEYAHSFINGEIKDILGKIKKKSKQKRLTYIDDSIDQSKTDDYFFVCSPSSLYSFSRITEKVKYRRNNLETVETRATYSIGDKEIPIYEFGFDYETVLLLNKAKFGKLYQLNPFNEEFSDKYKLSYFYFFIDFYSQNEDLMKEMLNNPPEWLKEKNNQEEYLKLHGVIKIYEKYKFKFDNNFEGYKFRVREKL